MKSKSTIYKFKKSLLLLTIIFLSSCASRQDIVYFQDEPLDKEMAFSNNYEIKFKPSDMLTIDISAQDPEAVMPFLLTPVSQNANSLNINNNLRMQTYLIDINGNIEFPVLGTLKMQGLSRVEATEMLKNELSEYSLGTIMSTSFISQSITLSAKAHFKTPKIAPAISSTIPNKV